MSSRLIASRGVGETDNLTELENLNEQTLLEELHARYNKDNIYTYVGEILVAVNPFKMIAGIYDKPKSLQYTNIGDRSSQPPHIFAVADVAFQTMVQGPNGEADQVAVISGESGAGKTESAKLFMKHVIYLSTKGMASSGAVGLEEKIIQLNPLLESFGNAQTLMNDNSSRFGKFVQLQFNNNHTIEGALMSEYLLEKSRVVHQAEGERNFHVFYLFFSGLDETSREKFQVSDPSEHRIINGNDKAVADIGNKIQKEMYKELTDCVGIVGFSETEVDNLFSLLAGVLHIGDVEFAGDEEAYIVSADDILGKCCSQLGVVQDAFMEALTSSINITRGESVVRKYKPYESEDVRDATAKALYGKAFTWIVKRVNRLLGAKSVGNVVKNIGVLDIFGFETFEVNSFEQLLINLANERLQEFFNDHIFKMELDEYAKEGIDGSQINYEDNKDLLAMLLDKPSGLLSLCDEEALFPNGTDKSMLEKFHQNLASRKGYVRPKGNDMFFNVQHYAGNVKYQAEGFLDKNRDTLAMDIVAALRLSENALVRTLFEGDDDDAKAAKRGRGKRDAMDARKSLRQSMKKVAKAQAKAKKTTVSAEFKASLLNLVSKMSRADPHFVRCIKPNLQKKSGTYDNELVTRQLQYTGMLETTRIRKEGYAYRPTFTDFVKRYKVLGFPFTSNPPHTDATCRQILENAGLTGWQIGKTKVFLRYFHMDELNMKFMPFPRAAQSFQMAARGFIARQRVKKLLAAAEAQRKAVESLCNIVEKTSTDNYTVQQALCDEDSARPADFWTKKEAPKKFEDPEMKKLAKKAGKKGGVTRAESVRWFKNVELKKGAGVSKAGKFEEWFHGVLTRKESEALLKGNEPGTFLVRVSESRFGYSLSHVVHAGGRVKHYMIDQTPDGRYQVIGNRRTFGSLNELVEYHTTHKIVSDDPVCLVFPCGQVGEHDDRLELVDKKTKGLLG